VGGLVCEFGVGGGGGGGRWGGGKVGRGEGKVRNLRVRNGSLFCTSPI